MHHILYLLCILFLICSPYSSFARPDSLLNIANDIVASGKSDAGTIRRLYETTAALRQQQPDTALFFAKWLESKSAALNDKELHIRCIYMEAELYNMKGQYLLSGKMATEGVLLSRQMKNDSLLAAGYNSSGVSQMHLGKYDEGLQFLNTALKIRERIRDKKGIATTLCSIGLLYYESQNPAQSKKYIDLALASEDNDHVLLNALHTKANILGMEGDYEAAFELDRRGLEVCKIKNVGYAYSMFYDNMANCYMYLGQYVKAKELFFRSLRADSALGNVKMMSDTYSNLSIVSILQGHSAESISYGLRAMALSRSADNLRGVCKAYENLAEVYQRAGMYQKALEYANKTASLKDSLVDKRTKDKLDEFSLVYETARKESELKDLKQKQQIDQLRLREQQLLLQKRNYQILAVSGITVLFLIVGALLYNRQRYRQRQLREKAILNAEYTERMRIARDVHDDLGSGLSRITLMAELAQQRLPADHEIGTTIKGIAGVSKELVENMRDMIWLLNPVNTSLENLLVHTREYISDYLEEFGIQSEIEIPDNCPDLRLSREAHRNIFLTIKEGVHNAVKHARATKLSLKITWSGRDVTIVIKDNGQGFADKVPVSGNGLKNMRQRIEGIGGRFAMYSPEGEGTIITICAPLPLIHEEKRITS